MSVMNLTVSQAKDEPTLVLQSVLHIFLALKLACMLQDYRHGDERTCFLLKYFGFDFFALLN